MPQSATIWHNGSVLVQPSPCLSGPSSQDSVNTAFSGTYSSSTGVKRLTVVGATDISPFVVSMDSVVRARFLVLRVVNGASIKLLFTSSVGTDQKLDVSSMFLWHSPNSGDEITAIKLVGTADIELMIAGDVS